MSDALWQALLANLPAIITALASVLAAAGALLGVALSVRNGAKADALATTADVIVGHVNSAATKASGDIAALRHEVEMLRATAAEQREAAALLAQAAVRPPTGVQAPQEPRPPKESA